MSATTTARVLSPLSVEEVQALPALVDLVTAGRALRIGRNRSYEQADRGEFPITVLRNGRFRYVTKSALCAHLGISLTP